MPFRAPGFLGAVKLEWNRTDYYLESSLPVGVLVYIGSAALQQESTVYGGTKYSGGAFSQVDRTARKDIPFAGASF
jgi:hypothetical protein